MIAPGRPRPMMIAPSTRDAALDIHIRIEPNGAFFQPLIVIERNGKRNSSVRLTSYESIQRATKAAVTFLHNSLEFSAVASG